LHVHTDASDGVSSVLDVLARAQNAELDVLAITDHNTIENALLAQSLSANYGLEVVVGEEISTRQGHLLALFIKEAIPPGLSLSDTIQRVHGQNGLAIIPHPYDYISFGVLNPWRRGLNRAKLLAMDFDAIEVFNGCIIGLQPNRKAEELATTARSACVCGSDAHIASAVGTSYTSFRGRTAEALRMAIIDKSTVPHGHHWSLQHYLGVMRRRELRYARVAASHAVSLCSAAGLVAALNLRSGIARLF